MKISGKDLVKVIKSEGEERAFSFEMRTKRSAIICGVCGVEISAPDNISLRLISGGEVGIIGKQLCCTSFGNRTVEVEGKIETVNFEARNL